MRGYFGFLSQLRRAFLNPCCCAGTLSLSQGNLQCHCDFFVPTILFKTIGQSEDRTEDRLRPAPALKIQNLQELHLGQDNMVWQGLHKALEKCAFALSEQLALRLEWPRSREQAVARLAHWRNIPAPKGVLTPGLAP